MKGILIGAGVVGERILQQAANSTSVEIVAMYDANTERLQEMAARYNVQTTSSLEELLEIEAEFAYIGTPPISHMSLTEGCAKRGLHVICEKPLAHNEEEGKRMVEIAKVYGVKTAMHFPMIYGEEFLYVEKAIQQQELGDVIQVELSTYFPQWPRPWQENNWIRTREQGGFIREIFPHYLQMTERLFGEGSLQSHQTHYPQNPELCEQSVCALAQLPGNIPFVLQGAHGVAEQEQIIYRIHGTKKTMTIRNWAELWVSTPNQPEQRLTLQKSNISFLDEVSLYFQGKGSNYVSFEEGASVQHIIDSLLK